MSEESKDLVEKHITLPEVRKSTGEIEVLTRTSEYLPQVRIYGSESTIVKEGVFPMGHLGLYKSADNIVDLGTEVDAVILDWRPRAAIVSGDSPVSFFGKYNEETSEWEFSKEFLEIKQQAMSKVKGYLVGLEYLMYLPEYQCYCLFFMGSVTLRRESANMKAILEQDVPVNERVALIKIKLIKTSQYTWHGVTVTNSSTPAVINEDPDDVIAEIQKFRNPQDSGVELADSDETGRAR